MKGFPRCLQACLAAVMLACAPVAAPARGTDDAAWPEAPFASLHAYLHGDAAGLLLEPPGSESSWSGTIIILHDTDGLDGRAAAYVEQLLGANFAILDLHLLGERPQEALIAAVASRSGRVGILAFGAAGRLATSMPGPAAGRALLYPGCAVLAEAGVTAGGRVLLVQGTADRANLEADCDRLGHLFSIGGSRVERQIYPGAGYAWDYPQFPGAGPTLLTTPDGLGRVRAGSSPELAALSAAQVAGFFAQAAVGR